MNVACSSHTLAKVFLYTDNRKIGPVVIGESNQQQLMKEVRYPKIADSLMENTLTNTNEDKFVNT